MQSELKPITKESASDKLAEAMDAAIKRLETIQETHAEICLGDDLAHYRTALALYRRIPSFAQREAAWNTRPTANEQDAMDWLVSYTAPALPEEYAYDSDQMIDAFMARCPRIPSALSRNELPADVLDEVRDALHELLHAVCDETGFAQAVRNDSGMAYPWEPLDFAEAKARAALAKLSAMSSGEPAPDVSNSITRDRSHTADRTIQCEYNSELEPDGKASDKTNRQSGERNESRRRAEILASGNEYGQRDLCAEDRRHDTIDSEGGGEVHSAPTFPAPDVIEAIRKLLVSAKMLQANSCACVHNHYGEDFQEQGMPAWLFDTQRDITNAESVLAKLSAMPSGGE